MERTYIYKKNPSIREVENTFRRRRHHHRRLSLSMSTERRKNILRRMKIENIDELASASVRIFLKHKP